MNYQVLDSINTGDSNDNNCSNQIGKKYRKVNSKNIKYIYKNSKLEKKKYYKGEYNFI